MANLKAILEAIKMIIAAYKYIRDEISEAAFEKEIRYRKHDYKKFVEGDRRKRLEILRKQNEEK